MGKEVIQVSGQTESELLFERFCQERRIDFKAIPVKGYRTPDYEIFSGDKLIVAEITQLDPNEDDRRYSNELRSKHRAEREGKIGQRVRQKITDKADQLRARSKGKISTILIVYNNTDVRSYTSPDHIRAAMFGFDTIVVAVPNDPTQAVSLRDRKFGKGAKVTEKHNTSLSAVGVIEQDTANHLKLAVYHNVHARCPINPAQFAGVDGVEQHVLQERIPGQFQGWVTISLQRV